MLLWALSPGTLLGCPSEIQKTSPHGSGKEKTRVTIVKYALSLLYNDSMRKKDFSRALSQLRERNSIPASSAIPISQKRGKNIVNKVLGFTGTDCDDAAREGNTDLRQGGEAISLKTLLQRP